ncbi:hypothetical protein B0181_02640 [Moraxella caviae]|uniref:Uncharacterized protein n=1 Tax=Moraxella caviae TaxID=34060 RepID=A0A1T0A7U2_9GAMM|nr:hypothetical protein [Moraxella caviae]OOR91767.1 hypothetical protein B0181_02640 [Moraxella caviae]STZ14191.1 Uncharacterised protein [Moraxella caviae]VEW12637.1 Uncharacterised protein [Moraxella caviae]VEW13577.1 Uncharacterised protein [Moraxella caviae]
MKAIISKALLCVILTSSTISLANEGFDKDVQEYAKIHDVGINEAKKALTIELHRDGIIDLIENQYKGRLAGIYIENKPTYKIVVRLTGDGVNQTTRLPIKNQTNISVPVELIYGAKATRDVAREQLKKAKKLAQQYLTNVQMVGFNEKTGQINVEVKGKNTDETQAKINQLLEAWKNPNVDLNIVFVNYSIVPMAMAYGGVPVADK